MTEQFDVIIVGAGLSGVGAAYHLQKNCPDRTFAILEARAAIGGTWDLFRYPGIRSDSDMHTLGYDFRPWTQAKAIADGPSIREYIEDTAREHGIDRQIRFGHRVKSAAWSTADAAWTLEVEHDGAVRQLRCNFLYMCSGYYDYAKGHAPTFAGTEQFEGRIVHPQFWPGDLDYKDKKVVVIGSGATAVTLVPEMAKQAAHVTMLQRSPTYVVSRPAEDGLANRLRAMLPAKAAYGITRWKNVLFGMLFYNLARKRPARTKERLLGMVREHLGPDYDVETHFTPRYNPWDQRLCLVPDADLFDTIKRGQASVVTDTIETFTRTGIRLMSGKEIAADVVVTATGLELALMGGATFSVDGAPVRLADTLQYKGMMFSDVPNLAFTFGYTNASWTLKADLVARYVCRLLNAMRRKKVRQATPRIGVAAIEPQPFADFSSGYIQRAIDNLPRQGNRKPWRLNQNYALDVMALRFGSIENEMELGNPAREFEIATA
ncbi:NAD(P)/FAD-dependent oxidoreductase [uncultured Sphingomonas sp.]|uniref:flavin-containing monooxygenase n=1 Tax=uncultured Sphingomonas sp. TaxID=158754 RepID=UPI0025FF1BA0|nr:NAD(P)/FAD-dependent oxidoreductase [uncultured Sphingomonas sp.]